MAVCFTVFPAAGKWQKNACSIIGSCWINRCQEVFDTPEGKALLAKWGLSGNYRGVANCILGYPDGPFPAPKARKADYIRKV